MEKETYEQYKIRKGITNIHQANILLGLDAIRIISEKMKEANRLSNQKQNT
jgi:hypothetical protein